MNTLPSPLSLAHSMQSRFLEGLATSDCATIIAAAYRRQVLADSVLVNQGEPAERLFLVTKGCARYFYITPQGRNIVLFWLPPGHMFGGAALLAEPSNYLVGTEMVKDGSVLVWRRAAIRTLAIRFPRLLDNALSIASDYLAWYLAAHLGLVCDSAHDRLAHVLVSLGNGIGQKRPDGIHIDITNEQLAETANITIFTASRLISEWQRTGALAKSRGKLILRSSTHLFRSS